ncbi:MAG TPA: MazG nucleotide pyrophosphohydrolase domain-containing protein [Symbiobacteriaceae bacterium]|nr:MazG nucleotide pyrophosphohydrolase domain-containing protein [Symbiobacteriaceae bacterium]
MMLPELQMYVREKLVARNLVTPLPTVTLHMVEEVGEVARAIRKGDRENLAEELADCLFLLVATANAAEVDLMEAFAEKEKRNSVRFGA